MWCVRMRERTFVNAWDGDGRVRDWDWDWDQIDLGDWQLGGGRGFCFVRWVGMVGVGYTAGVLTCSDLVSVVP